MSYLIGLTQKERDALLETIVYVDKPREIKGILSECNTGFMPIINYSQIYNSVKDKSHTLPIPSSIRTGDSVRNCEYRGVGTMYAIWLRKGLIIHDEPFLTTFLVKLLQVRKMKQTVNLWSRS